MALTRLQPRNGRPQTPRGLRLGRVGADGDPSRSAELGRACAIHQPPTEMGAGIAASPHCAERRIYRFPWSEFRRTHSLKSKLTSSGVAFHLTTPSEEETDRLPDRATRGFACLSTIGAWQSQSHPMFRGPSWVDHSCVPLCSSDRSLPSRVALEEDQLFRRLFPTGPANLRRASHCLSAEIGSSVTLRFLLALAGFPVEAGTSVPITF